MADNEDLPSRFYVLEPVQAEGLYTTRVWIYYWDSFGFGRFSSSWFGWWQWQDSCGGGGGGSLCSLSAVGTNRRPEVFGVLVFTPSIWLIAALRVAVVAAAADFGVGWGVIGRLHSKHLPPPPLPPETPHDARDALSWTFDKQTKTSRTTANRKTRPFHLNKSKDSWPFLLTKSLELGKLDPSWSTI